MSRFISTLNGVTLIITLLITDILGPLGLQVQLVRRCRTSLTLLIQQALNASVHLRLSNAASFPRPGISRPQSLKGNTCDPKMQLMATSGSGVSYLGLGRTL